MKVNVLILRKPRVTSDLHVVAERICAGARWGGRTGAENLLSSGIFYFLSRGFRGAVTLWSFSGGHKVII